MVGDRYNMLKAALKRGRSYGKFHLRHSLVALKDRTSMVNSRFWVVLKYRAGMIRSPSAVVLCRDSGKLQMKQERRSH